MTRSGMRFGLAVPAAVVALSLSAVPAIAAAPVENQAQDSATSEPLGHAIGNAGSLLSVIRVLPGSDGLALPVPGLPGAGEGGSNGTPLSLGFGLSSAQSNSESGAPNSLAEAAPFAGSITGMMPATPGSASQSAPPDNETPATGGFDIPNNPLITGGLLNTSAHARYSDTLGPCVRPLAAAKTSTADVQVLSALPGLEDISGLENITDILDQSNLLEQLPALTPDELTALLGGLEEPLQGLFDALGGLGGLENLGDGVGLASLPDTLSTESTVKLAPIKGSKNKAVQSTSKVQVTDLKLLSGTPFALRVKVASQPTLTVTSTGKKETSTIKYTKPILEIFRGDDEEPLYRLDPDNPFAELPLTVPIDDIPGGDSLNQLDLGVVRISIGQQQNSGELKRKGENDAPFSGYELGSVAQLMKVQILPSDLLDTSKLPTLPAGTLPTGPGTPSLPSLPDLGNALAEISFGEQTASAYAPTDGVNCGVRQVTNPNPPAESPPAGEESPPLAYTDAAYQTVPLLWTGAGMVLAGAVLVGYRPLRRALVKITKR